MIFDNNDLLAVFDNGGKLVGSALLSWPISITDHSRRNPNMWTEGTANRIATMRGMASRCLSTATRTSTSRITA